VTRIDSDGPLWTGAGDRTDVSGCRRAAAARERRMAGLRGCSAWKGADGGVRGEDAGGGGRELAL
jgi:hypothetical protein